MQLQTHTNAKKLFTLLLFTSLTLGLLSCGGEPAGDPADTTAGPTQNTTKEEDDVYKDDGYLRLITNIKRTEQNLLSRFCDMYHPTVLKEQLPGCEGYPYTMWFFGWSASDTNPGYPGCDAMFLARGKDLYTWEVWSGEGKWDDTMRPSRWVPIITADESAWYDNWHNGDPTVVKKDGMFYMAYSSYASGPDMKFSWEKGDVDADLCCVMGAYSEDGIHWTKSGEPILMWEPEMNDPNFSASNMSADAEHFRGLYHRPSLMYDESINKWRIWFDYFDGVYLSVGYAEADGAGREIDVLGILGARRIGLGALVTAKGFELVARLAAEQILDGVKVG